MSNTAEKFWKNRTEYPPVTCNFQRRYLDLGIMMNYIEGVDAITDLGCGEGQLLLMLRELTNIEMYFAFDLSESFIRHLMKRWGGDKKHLLFPAVGNFVKAESIPNTPLCVCMGVMLYILDDDELRFMLNNIRSDTFICRVPCSMGERVEIDKFSNEYGGEYAAVYRTIPEYISILSECFDIKSIDRCYPDEIESKFGTKQYYFVCKRR